MGVRQLKKDHADMGKAENELKREFAERLSALRKAAGQTQSQVAKALGFTSESVYQLWEKPNGNLPNALNLRKLALHFAVSVDDLLGMQEGPIQVEESPVETLQDEQVQAQRKLFQLALQGHDYNSPEVAPLFPILRRSRLETREVCYQRVVTDAIYQLPLKDLPSPERFRTAAARQIEEEIEIRFRTRPAARARQVKMYVLDLAQVPDERLQRNILGMQGAELIKKRRANFTLAISNGRMARNVVMAPNLVRGDIENVKVIPLTLGMNLSDQTATSTLIGTFVFDHGDYGVTGLELEDSKPRLFEWNVSRLDLAFMGIGSVESESHDSFFHKLLKKRGLKLEDLKAEGVIGNVLYQLICEDASGQSWKRYEFSSGKEIAVGIDEQAGDEVLRAVDIDVLQRLIKAIGEVDDGSEQESRPQVVIVVKDLSRARVVRAALEMQYVNTVICTLDVAHALQRLLSR